jgi:hypothetical protein
MGFIFHSPLREDLERCTKYDGNDVITVLKMLFFMPLFVFTCCFFFFFASTFLPFYSRSSSALFFYSLHSRTYYYALLGSCATLEARWDSLQVIWTRRIPRHFLTSTIWLPPQLPRDEAIKQSKSMSLKQRGMRLTLAYRQ